MLFTVRKHACVAQRRCTRKIFVSRRQGIFLRNLLFLQRAGAGCRRSNDMKITEWKKDDRPRERFESNGAGALGDAELIAILIRTGHAGKSAVALARDLIASAGNSLAELSKMSIEKIAGTPGMGKVKAITIKAAFELGRRFAMEEGPSVKNSPVSDSGKAFRLLYPRLKSLDHEECWVIFLNKGNRVISIEKVSSGGSSSTVIDRKAILKSAVEKLASGLILAHNHPSGNRFPGECDIRETRALKEAARMMDIVLIDHIIIAGEDYYSFSDNSGI